MKAEVWKTIDGLWVADYPREGWVDRSYFSQWEDAMDHAEWLALKYGRRQHACTS